jgi:uncharacterized protein
LTVFIDTSAFYAILDRDDENHPAAGRIWTELLLDGATFLTTNYVLVETAALIQHRLGTAAYRGFAEDIQPLLQVEWVAEDLHHAATHAVLAAARRKLSLVDCVSFQTMRRHDIRTAFCFDAHFREQGFAPLS